MYEAAQPGIAPSPVVTGVRAVETLSNGFLWLRIWPRKDACPIPKAKSGVQADRGTAQSKAQDSKTVSEKVVPAGHLLQGHRAFPESVFPDRTRFPVHSGDKPRRHS